MRVFAKSANKIIEAPVAQKPEQSDIQSDEPEQAEDPVLDIQPPSDDANREIIAEEEEIQNPNAE